MSIFKSCRTFGLCLPRLLDDSSERLIRHSQNVMPSCCPHEATILCPGERLVLTKFLHLRLLEDEL